MRFALALALAFALAATAALAHDPQTLDRMPSPHGGQVRMAGPYHLELVLEPRQVTLHVMDHANREIAVAGGRATATFTASDESETVELLPTGRSTLGRAGEFPATPGVRVEVTIAIPGQGEWSTTFTPQGEADSAG
jgi:hypothetical protein